MSEAAVVAIARIPLARSARQLLLAPMLLLLIAAGAATTALLLLPGWEGFALLAAAAALCLVALYLVAVVLSVRVEVEVSTLRVRWLGADRRFALARGAVTRVPLRGERAAKLRPRFGAFGWGLGRARLRGEETIHLVRLAKSPAIILVPTEAGRVAVAPRSEEQFLEALAGAARVQQRLDQFAARARAIPLRPPIEEVEPEPGPQPLPEPAARPLTGIERTLLEERLAAERAAALAAAEAEREAAARAITAGAGTVEPTEAATLPELTATGAEPSRRRAFPRPTVPRIGRPRALPAARLVSLGVAGLPLGVAAALWGAATLAGSLEPDSLRFEQVSVGLVLAGPAAALAALAARAWFPRLVGLVVITAACALILVGRALIV